MERSKKLLDLQDALTDIDEGMGYYDELTPTLETVIADNQCVECAGLIRAAAELLYDMERRRTR